ncbi:LysR family transcriptional regulator [Rhodanobacter sp. FW102-FHT14D06]|mgnify:FL=1|jgi:DNA-binding transcriptional LysR family regulator|uniref:LysR family transcriptional regulator n=2 Tax=unclassified Rhodanobacter TaxID=2621553 RepID=A0AB74V128_9GAMM|nr:LysR family transcriptional regulator [Rhodanobacter sp.]ODT90168.1 MAG: D-alanyl-D-alanine endopeptidase [Rhodanobacter sp. SCN 67-45]
MELRHMRRFLAVAEELHFARAAERLHIEQSPLSRAIKELESDLGAQLFERTTRSTRLTWAGQVFLEDVHRVFAALDQARVNVKAAANGYHGTLRIAVSDGIVPSRLAALLAQCRAEEPEVETRLFQTPFAQQVKGLRSDLYDVGFAQSDEVVDGILAEPVWQDPLVAAVPARHPLLIHKRIPLEDVLRYPLVLCHPEACEGCARQIERVLRTVDAEPIVIDRVTTRDMLITLVAAGYGIGLTNATHIEDYRHPEVVVRPLAGRAVMLTTYLLRPDGEPSEPLRHFIDRVSSDQAPLPGNKP